MKVTVALVDVPAFCARYGLTIRKTGNRLDVFGLPEYGWVAEHWQTDEQARLVESELKDGTKWNASKFS